MKKKVLFVDRDGTIIREATNEIIDSLENMRYVKGVFNGLGRIMRELDYELVMVTNQDGLGTPENPQDKFDLVQNKMLEALEDEGISFDKILIDVTYPSDNVPTRKPNTGLLTRYFEADYDLENSFMVGDRWTDIELAKNFGGKGIFITSEFEFGLSEIKNDKTALEQTTVLQTNDWNEIYRYLSSLGRTTTISRNTAETKIKIDLNLDGSGRTSIATGLAFFDHMLEQIGKHGLLDLEIKVQGDLEVDEHHTIEDTGLALGQAFGEALGSKLGIERYAFVLPMDDCLAQVALDFGGRSELVWAVNFTREKIGDVPTEMFKHFFKSFCDTAKCNLNIKCEGENEHHKIESIFKAFARVLKTAISRNFDKMNLPSTKGVL